MVYEGNDFDEIIVIVEKVLVDINEYSNCSGFRKIFDVLKVNYENLELCL